MILLTYVIFLMNPANYIFIVIFYRYVHVRFTAFANIWPGWYVASAGPDALAKRC